MKFRPSKRIVWLLIPLAPLAVMFLGIWCAGNNEKVDTATRGSKPPAERKFSVSQPSSWSTAFDRPADWIDQGMDFISTWEMNPWRNRDRYVGGHLKGLQNSPDPMDQASYQDLMRLGREWHARLLARFPELAPTYRDVPDGKNGLLRWTQFLAGLADKTNPAAANSILPDRLWDDLKRKWDPASAATWLDANRPLIDEIRAIGLMTDRSSKGMDSMDFWDGKAALMMDAARALMLDARVAAGQGDLSRMVESLRAANGLADHLTENESPVLIQWLVGNAIHRRNEQYVLDVLIPSLPPRQAAQADWESLMSPPSGDPEILSRVTRGEWNAMMAAYLLPVLSDPAEPMLPDDADSFVEMFTRSQLDKIRSYQDATLQSPGSSPFIPPDIGSLSWKSRELARGMGMQSQFDALAKWQDMQTSAGFFQAALAIYQGRPVPKDPVSGQDYLWDPSTRQLSVPPGTKKGPKPLIVPKR